MTSRKKYLKRLGFQEPYDESPVDTPEGWYGGAVEHTGGRIYCRIWRTVESTIEKEGETALEVIYNLLNDETVAINRQEWDDYYEGYTHAELLDTREADRMIDYRMAEAARELMETHG
jgi:hypothetical protein